MVKIFSKSLVLIFALAVLAFPPAKNDVAVAHSAASITAQPLTPTHSGTDVLQPQDVLMFVRVKHDNPPRQVLVVSPETVPLSDRPGSSNKGSVIPIDKAWQDFDAQLNSPKAFRWLLTPNAALVNTDYGPGDEPQAESITFGGNVLLIDQIMGHYGHVRSFDYSAPPPSSTDAMNYQNYPQFIQKVTAIDSRNGAIRNPGAALDVYFALLRKTDLWIDLDRVEAFPALPMKVSPQDWITRGLRVHETCQIPSPEISGLYPSQTAMLTSYVPRGSDVLGLVNLPNGKTGCIALLYRGTEYTGWHMDTVPPVRPVK